jgi:hypothetical protein
VGSDIQPAEVVAAVGDTSVEVVLPVGGSCRQLSWSGGSVVLRVDPVGGTPDIDFTDEGDARLSAGVAQIGGVPSPLASFRR